MVAQQDQDLGGKARIAGDIDCAHQVLLALTLAGTAHQRGEQFRARRQRERGRQAGLGPRRQPALGNGQAQRGQRGEAQLDDLAGKGRKLVLRPGFAREQVVQGGNEAGFDHGWAKKRRPP